MLKIAEQWWASDVGRQRSNNEDNYFARAPLFAVSDGMGGAQAGEVASAETVKTFKEGMPDAPPGEALVEIIQTANRRIHHMSRESTERQGMGCTVTAAYVDDDDIVIAHVGDSRAYLFRDGDLIRLTRDHSLVGDLVALGKITEEEAEHHPQRSVITRALGPEADVQVDLEVYPGKPGDVYLLCSDGLTSMVSEQGVKQILAEADSLEAAGRALIAAANDAGGRDNITVILFRVGDPGAGAATGAGEPEATGEYDTLVDSREGISQPRSAEAPRGGGGLAEAPPATDEEKEPDLPRDESVATSAAAAPEPASGTLPETRPPEKTGPPPRRRKLRRRIGVLVGVLIAAGLILIGGWVATRAVYFVGTGEDGRTLAVFRGLPYELPLGIDLYSTEYRSGVTIDQVPERRRAAFLDHKLRSLNDAKDLVVRLERGEISQ
jgi:serine/threonine protein phosphatase PrpC